MRIAYVSLHWPRTLNSGVGKKISQQISLWRAAGHQVHFFMHTHPFAESDTPLEGDYFQYETGQSIAGKIRAEFSRSTALAQMLKRITGYRPNLIYVRWGMYVYPLHRCAAIAPVVVEINTNDVSQHRLLGRVLDNYNRLTRSLLLRSAAGFVSVSQELSQAEEFASFHKPTLVMGNGFDGSTVQPFPPPHNSRPRLVFIGSPDTDWHGVDKLVAFARQFPDLDLEVVGYDSIPVAEALPENLHLHGYLHEAEYKTVLASADAAFGSLALHRIGLDEASPLKTRECLAYGLPLINAFRDTDLDDLNCDFLLKIPNREDNLLTDGQAVHDFAFRVMGKRADVNIVAERIGLQAKEQKRLAFFTSLASPRI